MTKRTNIITARLAVLRDGSLLKMARFTMPNTQRAAKPTPIHRPTKSKQKLIQFQPPVLIMKFRLRLMTRMG